MRFGLTFCCNTYTDKAGHNTEAKSLFVAAAKAKLGLR